MKRVLEFLKEHKYLMVLLIIVGFSVTLGLTYSNFIVTSNNHKAAEMYIGALKYSIEIDESITNTLTIPTGETIIDVKVNNLNPVDTYYKLLYLNNSNLTVEYFDSAYELDDSNNVTKSYDKPNDSVTSSNTKTIKLKITNNSTSSQTLGLSVKGGYITNTLSDIMVPSTYNEITLVNASSNMYFCKTNDTLTQGLLYVNGQYTYAYKQENKYKDVIPVRGYVWSNITEDGWGVKLTDRKSTDVVTSKVCIYINNKPIISMSGMFALSRASSIDLSSLNTTNVTNMSDMLANSKTIILDLSNFDTSNVTNMSGIFSGSQATTLDVSNFDTSKVTNMSNMFSGSQATTLDVSNFDTSNVTNMQSMFERSQATELDLSNFDTSKVTNMERMFSYATNLKTIYVSDKFNIDNVTSSDKMFTSSTNLVGGAGTKYDANHVGKTYARIDGGTSNPGYFTDIADKDIPAPNSFATDSWKTIIKAVRNNNIGKYNVGDTKTVDLGTYGTHTLRIANTSTPSECSTSGFSQTACGFVLEFADIITTHKMNDTDTNVGGWPATSMRTFVNNDIYNAIPSEIKNAIIDTTVVSGHGSEDTENFTSTDKLYLLSPKEIYTDFSHTYDTAKDLTRTLDYYTAQGVTTSNYIGAIKKNGTNVYYWWLRAADSYNNIDFLCVHPSGYYINFNANIADGVAPAFRIG